jgi:predicted ATPase
VADVAVLARLHVEPTVQVVEETLRAEGRTLLATETPTGDSADIQAEWAGGGRSLRFRADRLLATQVLARVPATTEGQAIHLAAAQVLAALRAVFVLDPVPPMMRQYVPRRDTLLRRDADNLSAAVASLLAEPATAQVLSKALSQLNEQEVVDVTTSSSDLDDVMLTLVERFAGHDQQVPARVMSDGTLRFLAILVALLQSPTIDTMPEPLASEDASGQTTVVVEELENGLHASQAQLLIRLIRDEVGEHRSVVVCQRDANGRSSLARLVDLPNYLDVVAAGGLGRAAERDRLRVLPSSGRSPSEVLDEIFGGPG